MPVFDKDQAIVLGVLAQKGVASAQDLQAAIGKSQATVSRVLDNLSGRVLVLGKARATRYALPKSIRGYAAQQPFFWTHESGTVRPIGTLSFLEGGLLHVESDYAQSATSGALPWFLTPLHVQGFLGRLHAQRLEPSGIGANPEHWRLEDILFSALHLRDASGGITVGNPDVDLPAVAQGAYSNVIPPRGNYAEAFDRMARDVARTLPAGSSAGGEQPKFLCVIDATIDQPAQHLLVKFTPPRRTPFGERWHDLLHAEALANATLSEHGVDVAGSEVVESETRTYLVSRRFDRIGQNGRRHVVSVGNVHNAFVTGSYGNWDATCTALASQRRLSALDAERATALRAFGQLIGNTDMHSGNLGLFVELEDLAKGRFTLAPVYDMLPMRWRPDPLLGGAPDYTPFNVDGYAGSTAAVTPATDFWRRLARSRKVSAGLANVAADMAGRIAALA